VYRAGTTTPLAGATVRLTSGPDGGGRGAPRADERCSGNFYTTQSIGFSAGAYADANRPERHATFKRDGR